MTDHKALARVLVLQKALLDEWHAADNDTREQARSLFESGDAAAVTSGKDELGRVRRDKPRKAYRITNPGAFEAWVKFNFPEGLATVVAPWVLEEIRRNGYLTRTSSGEVFEPAGVELVESGGGALVVTTTPAAKAWARELVGRTVAGELE